MWPWIILLVAAPLEALRSGGRLVRRQNGRTVGVVGAAAMSDVAVFRQADAALRRNDPLLYLCSRLIADADARTAIYRRFHFSPLSFSI